mgnify:CR=1 FL=1
MIFLFAGLAIQAVGTTAEKVVEEVRRQLKETPGIMTREVKPDYQRCVAIVTDAALREMILPGSLAVIMPVTTGLVFRWLGDYTGNPLLGAEVLAGYLMFATVSGILMALFLDNVGGAWDNAKKYIELGHHGGKGSPAHKAAVTGDTVGDPFKDTAGPALHVVIKLLSTTILVLAPLFVSSAQQIKGIMKKNGGGGGGGGGGKKMNDDDNEEGKKLKVARAPRRYGSQKQYKESVLGPTHTNTTPRFEDGRASLRQSPVRLPYASGSGRRETMRVHCMCLHSAYEEYNAGSEPRCTMVHDTFNGTMDYIFYNHETLSVRRLLSVPKIDDLRDLDPRAPKEVPDPYDRKPDGWDARPRIKRANFDTGEMEEVDNPDYQGTWEPRMVANMDKYHNYLPNTQFSSDHFALMAEFSFRDSFLSATGWNSDVFVAGRGEPDKKDKKEGGGHK